MMTQMPSDLVYRQVDILWILAHPDDESFGNAGTMALAADAGLTTGYVCATRGEVGEIRDPSLATRLTLPAVREQELRNAMLIVGVDELRLLPYRDSGMVGTPENADLRSLVSADLDELTAHVVAQIREMRPRVVVGFGPDGVYGHPDHVRIGEVVDRAIIEAASTDHAGLGSPWQIDAHYHVAVPRERAILSATNPESPFYGADEAVLNTIGIPAAEITHWIDTSAKSDVKFDAYMCHRTQIGADNPMTNRDSDIARAMLSVEAYRRCDLPWETAEPDPLNTLWEAHRATPAS